MQVDAFLSFTIAVILLLAGKIVTMNAVVLRRNAIPEPVVGGLLCTAAVALVFAFTGEKTKKNRNSHTTSCGYRMRFQRGAAVGVSKPTSYRRCREHGPAARLLLVPGGAIPVTNRRGGPVAELVGALRAKGLVAQKALDDATNDVAGARGTRDSNAAALAIKLALATLLKEEGYVTDFQVRTKEGKPVAVYATIEVNFRLL